MEIYRGETGLTPSLDNVYRYILRYHTGRVPRLWEERVKERVLHLPVTGHLPDREVPGGFRGFECEV